MRTEFAEGRRREFESKRLRLIAAARDGEVRQEDLARRFGVACATVSRWLTEAGLPRRRRTG